MSGRELNQQQERFTAWTAELGCPIPNSNDLKDHPVLAKVFRHLMPRVQLAKNAQKYVNFNEFTKLAVEMEANEADLRTIQESITRCSPVLNSKRRQLEMHQKLFFLVTSSQIYQAVANCAQTTTSTTNSSSSLSTMEGLATKMSALMETLKRYCNNVDSFEQLLKTDPEFNQHYFMHVVPSLKNGTAEARTTAQITEQIKSTMSQIVTNFEQVLQVVEKVENSSNLPSSSAVLTAPTDAVDNVHHSTTKVDMQALQEMLNKWMSLYNDDDAEQ